MPSITGTSGNDIIDVTDDTGTLNGADQGTPVEDIRAQDGDDAITVTDSTISQSIRGNTGDDTIEVTSSTVTLDVRGGNNNDTITITSSDVGVDVRGNAGNDDITVKSSTVGGLVHAGGDNDTVVLRGASVDGVRLGGGDDSIDFFASDVAGELRGNGGTDSLNLPVGTVVNDSTYGTFTVALGVSYNLSSGTFTLPSGTTVTYTTFENGTGIPCLVRGSRVLTDKGYVAVETLQPGHRVETRDNGFQPVRWTGRATVTAAAQARDEKLRPVRICAGSLGLGAPARDLLVSRQHRMLVQSRIAKRMFDTSEVLIPAHRLTALPGVFIEPDLQDVEYFHILFDRHEVIYANGVPTESLFTGPMALKSLSHGARVEIFKIFPELARKDYRPEPARVLPSPPQQKRLLERHRRNQKALLEAV